MQHYKKPNPWHGRIDEPKTKNNLRLHQIVTLLDLTTQNQKFQNGFCVLGFCSDEGVRRSQGRIGAKDGPQAIREALASLPVHKNVMLSDAGDVFCEGQDLETAHKNLEEAVTKILSLNLFPIVLGGGHEVAFGHFQGIQKFLKKKIGIINFDAHFDLRPYKNGASSGTGFLQIADKVGKDFSYFVLGIQNISNTQELFKTALEKKVSFLTSQEINLSDFSLSQKKISTFLKKHEHIYLTFCLDVFPANIAPGVSAPNPYGLEKTKAFALLDLIVNSKKVVGFDIAELAPRLDCDGQTAKLAASLIFQFITPNS